MRYMARRCALSRRLLSVVAFACFSLAFLLAANAGAAGSCAGVGSFQQTGHFAVGQPVPSGFFDPTDANKFSGAISWGDGTTSNFTINQSVSHAYTKAGTYAVTFSASGTLRLCEIGGGECRDDPCSDSNGHLFDVVISAGKAGASASASASGAAATKPAHKSTSGLLGNWRWIALFGSGAVIVIVVGAGFVRVKQLDQERYNTVVDYLVHNGYSSDEAHTTVARWAVDGTLEKPQFYQRIVKTSPKVLDLNQVRTIQVIKDPKTGKISYKVSLNTGSGTMTSSVEG